jgi:RNA polymerase sigma-70 factor (ECF subfamily)
LTGGEDSDEALVARAGRGDRAAASALVLRHTDRIFAASFRILRDRAAAEDATQETFLRLWRNASRWRPQGAKLETWLYKVAMNICFDILRRKRREAPEEAAQEQQDEAPRADQRIEAGQRSAAVQAALAELPDRQRVAITLCHYQELSNIDAAAAMGVSVEAIESLLARARRAMRAKLFDRREELLEGVRDDARPAAR